MLFQLACFVSFHERYKANRINAAGRRVQEVNGSPSVAIANQISWVCDLDQGWEGLHHNCDWTKLTDPRDLLAGLYCSTVFAVAFSHKQKPIICHYCHFQQVVPFIIVSLVSHTKWFPSTQARSVPVRYYGQVRSYHFHYKKIQYISSQLWSVLI